MKILDIISSFEKIAKERGNIDIDITTSVHDCIRNKEGMNKFKISIGDWSEDGHNMCDFFNYQSETPLVDIQNAFKKACEKNDISFNSRVKAANMLLCEYEQSTIPYNVLRKLENAGIDIDSFFDFEIKNYQDGMDGEAYLIDGADSLANLVLAIAKLELGFDYEEASVKNSEKVTPFNGWWTDNDMNFQIGYGIFHL